MNNRLDQLHRQRALRRLLTPVIVIPDDGVDEEIERQCEIQNQVKSQVDALYKNFARTGRLDFLSFADNLSYLGEDYLDAVYRNLLVGSGLYQAGYED